MLDDFYLSGRLTAFAFLPPHGNVLIPDAAAGGKIKVYEDKHEQKAKYHHNLS
jgi:hypothetical protein